jgi:hypothetical protein
MDEAGKSALRAEVELLTRRYLESGGRIDKVPTGKEALLEMTTKERLRTFSFFGPNRKALLSRTHSVPSRGAAGAE